MGTNINKNKKFVLLGVGIGLITLLFFAGVTPVLAGECEKNDNEFSLASFLNPFLSFAEKVVKDFGYDIALAATYPGATCGSAVTGCSGTTPTVTIDWPAAPNPGPYSLLCPYSWNLSYYTLTVNGVLWYQGIANSYALSGLPNNTSYNWSVEAYYCPYGCQTATSCGLSSLPSGSFTTDNCVPPPPPPPSVDFKVNTGEPGDAWTDGPISIPYNTSAELAWISANATACTGFGGSGGWPGAKSLQSTTINEDPTPGMLSPSGLDFFYASSTVDDNVNSYGWHTDGLAPGVYVQIDLGAGNEKDYVRARIYGVGTPPSSPVYDIKYSDDGSSWSNAVTGFVVSGGNIWNERSWISVGKHRFWRFVFTGPVGGGPWLSELEMDKLVPESTGNLTSSQDYTLTCTNDGGPTSRSVTVNVLPAATLTVNLSPTSIRVGGNSQATAMYDDGSGPRNVTTDSDWDQSDDTKATVDNVGWVTGVRPGSALIIATYDPDGPGPQTPKTNNAEITVSFKPFWKEIIPW
jgi:hypothetical protein